MAKLSELMTCVAEAAGIPESDVRQIGRRAREAGYIAQGARGNAAPDMRPEDAANLLIAILGSEFAKDAGQAIERYGNLEGACELVEDDYESAAKVVPDVLAWTRKTHTFRSAIERLIVSAMVSDFDKVAPFFTGKSTDNGFAKTILSYKYGNIGFNVVAFQNADEASIVFYDDKRNNYSLGSVKYNAKGVKSEGRFRFASMKSASKPIFHAIGKLLSA